MILLSGALALTLLAQAAGAPAGAVTKAQPDPEDRVVCVTDTSTGSMLPKKACHTRREWTRIKADEAEMQHSTSAVTSQRPLTNGR